MGFTSILGLVFLAIIIVLIYFIVSGVKERNWKKVIIAGAAILVIGDLMYFGLLFFVTSM